MHKLIFIAPLFVFYTGFSLKNENNKIATFNSSIKQPISDTGKTAASFPGGQQEWINFIRKNLNAFVPVKNSAPAGRYKVVVEFSIAPDGTVDNITPLTNFGYGMEEEFIRVMKKFPKWEPAKENGLPINSTERKTQLFVVSTAM